MLAEIAASSMLVIGSAMPALADTGNGSLNELANLNPGTSVTELKDSLGEFAQDEGISLDEAVNRALSESKASVREAKSVDSLANRSVASAASSGGSGTVTLGSATRKGDLFVSPASTLFVQHGRTGIYYSTATIVEAPGTGKNSRSIAGSSVKVGKGAVKQYVSTTATNRGKAANHAFNKLRGKGYNSNFAVNKSTTGSKMNCSQLVWAAYKAATGIDLDGNGGLGVYPYNIKDSSKTVTYKTL
ncbi:YiiX/YebB-like N1pC/P60 family cysteine hydrolase [Glutamicibacter nicotianae]